MILNTLIWHVSFKFLVQTPFLFIQYVFYAIKDRIFEDDLVSLCGSDEVIQTEDDGKIVFFETDDKETICGRKKPNPGFYHSFIRRLKKLYNSFTFGDEINNKRIVSRRSLKKFLEDLGNEKVADPEPFFSFTRYHSYDEISQYLTGGLVNKYPDLVELEIVGQSSEGRDLYLVKVMKKTPVPSKAIYFIDAGIHAREWIAPAAALYVINQLLQKNNRHLLDLADWFIMPLVNPDGYEFTRADPSNRKWRKTRSKYSGFVGVDGNRNFSYMWNTTGVGNGHSKLYPGPNPFSEPETRAVRDLIMLNRRRVKLYLTLHAQGRLITFPWCYTTRPCADYYRLKDIAKEVASAIYNATNVTYGTKPFGSWYLASGTSIDFVYAVAKIPYAFLLELTAGYGHQLPEGLIEENAREAWVGIKKFGELIASIYAKKE